MCAERGGVHPERFAIDGYFPERLNTIAVNVNLDSLALFKVPHGAYDLRHRLDRASLIVDEHHGHHASRAVKDSCNRLRTHRSVGVRLHETNLKSLSLEQKRGLIDRRVLDPAHDGRRARLSVKLRKEDQVVGLRPPRRKVD